MRNDDCRCQNQENLLLEIQKVSFVMDELRLFIDTHPDDCEALAMFNEYAEKRNELICRYNSEVMPISGYAAEQTGKWRWGHKGMPWRGGDK